MKANRKFAVAVLCSGTLLVACSGTSSAPAIDVRPIGQGLEFLGMAIVLAALVVVFGRFIGR
jgi:VIT1/CCC1 family predicted Fe2+/Mn2+ transporter